MLIELSEIMDFFFEAASKGWAAGKEGVPMEGVPEWRKIPYSGKRLFMLETYFQSPDTDLVRGDTMIWSVEDHRQMWYMHWDGTCEKSALAFLKYALLVTYLKRYFAGCRGETGYFNEERTLRYGNGYTNDMDFSYFRGLDHVALRSNEVSIRNLARIDYFGRMIM